MGIVVVTILGATKMAFVNSLHQKTNGGVDLVVVQKWKPQAYRQRMKQLARQKPLQFIREIWYALLLRLRAHLRETLSYFRESTPPSVPLRDFLPKSIFVDDINSDETYALIKKMSPDILAVWGSNILKPRFVATAKRAVNLHIGRCPYYRGTLANQLAVLAHDRGNIGATVHAVSPSVDAGNILAVVKPNLELSPRELFRDLNDRAQSTYIDIINRLYRGEALQGVPQDNIKGKNLILKNWTPSIRYHVAKEMERWEREFEENDALAQAN